MYLCLSATILASALLSNAAPLSTSLPPQPLPTVNLGYSVHQAISFNTTGSYYNFSNIRYAEPPIGELRFRAPVPVTGHNTSVDNGSVGRICPQALTGWFPDAEAFIPDYLSGKPFTPPPTSNGSAGTPDPRISEDCLFLDVIVPKSALDSAGAKKADTPVIVWIYGGGYVFGDKSGYDPAGLFANSPEPFIFVALNYRLGAFGFLAGSTVAKSGTPQPALLDQRLALTWVQSKIHLFGGSASRVTVMGESAGGGSIMHQITAYGGHRGSAPFQRAIVQSPAFVAQPLAKQAENNTQTFLRLCNATSIEDLRKLPAETLMAANAAQIGASPYGVFTFGPVVDGSFAPALPGELLATGAFDHSVEVMVGHNSDEGLFFTSPYSNSSSGFISTVKELFPTIAGTTLSRIENEFYPAVFNGSSSYTNQLDRTKLLVADTFITCNTDYLNRAFKNQTYAYQFSIPPGVHGEDLTYTFNDGATSGTDFHTATAMQQYLTTFAVDGVPAGKKGSGLPVFPRHGSDAEMINFAATGIETAHDPTANERCRFWQQVQEQWKD